MSKSPIRWFEPERFRELREDRGFTYAELGRRTGFAPATFRHWERGLHTPSMEALVITMEVLGTTPPDVLSIPPGQATLSDLRVLSACPSQDVAAALNLTPTGYSALERGEINLTEPRIAILSRLFGVTGGDIERAWERSR